MQFIKRPRVIALLHTLLFLTLHSPAAISENHIVVKQQTLPYCFSTLGILVANQKIEVTSRITGYLKTIEIREGQPVKKGELLAIIDEANVKGQILDFKAKLNQANSALKDALLDKNKFTTLYKSGSISENQHRKALLNYDLALERFAASKANLGVAKSQLTYTHIISPINGNITELYQRAGDLATPGKAIARIESINTLELKTEIPERYISQINPGDKVMLTIDAMAGSPSIESTISRIIPSSLSGTHTFQVFVTPNYQPTALPGMFGHVQFFIGLEQKIIIPKSIIVEQIGLRGIFISKNNNNVFRWLRLGDSKGEGIEVIAGLHENDVIAVSSPTQLALFKKIDTTLSLASNRGRCL